MRCLKRNQKPFYYALFASKVPITDDYGNDTGESEVVYSAPVRCFGNISAARGETSARQFGEDTGYDRVIVLENANTPIDEHAVLWIDSVPVITNGSTDTPWDYTVKKVARSLNSVSIAVSRVNVR